MQQDGYNIAPSNQFVPPPIELPQCGINSHLWQDILAESQIITANAGSKLFNYGGCADKFVIVLQGVLKVYESAENGREISLYRVYSGQVCMLSLTRMLHGVSRSAQAVAEEDVRLLAIPRDHFDRLVAESEDFRRYIMGAVSSCISDIMNLIAEVSFNNLDLRLARFIRQLSHRTQAARLRLTHNAIANELGTTREVISRLLKDFERAGCIKLGRGNIQVLSMDKLESLCT